MARHPTPPGSPRARSSRLLFFASAVLAALVVTQPWRPDPSRASRMLLEEEELPGASRQRAGSATVALDAAAAAAAVQLASAAAAAASSSSSSSSSVQAAQQQQQQGGLQGRAACVAAATTGPVPVHGWVKKAGPLPMHLLDGPVTPQRHQAYFRWRDARDDSKRTQQALVDGRLGERACCDAAAALLLPPPPRAAACCGRRGGARAPTPPGAPPPHTLPSAADTPMPTPTSLPCRRVSSERVGRAPPLFPYCRILVNHAYRTLYLKAPKTGSTSLLTLLGTCTGDAETDKPTCFQALQARRAGLRALSAGGPGTRWRARCRAPGMHPGGAALRLSAQPTLVPAACRGPPARRGASTRRCTDAARPLPAACERCADHRHDAGRVRGHVPRLLCVERGAQPLGPRRLLLPHALPLHQARLQGARGLGAGRRRGRVLLRRCRGGCRRLGACRCGPRLLAAGPPCCCRRHAVAPF